MILLPLLLSGLVAGGAQAARGARVHELRGRLGVGPAARERSSVKTRLSWAQTRAPQWADLLFAMVRNHLGLRDGEGVGPEVRDHALEVYLPWVATRLAVETDIREYPWLEAGSLRLADAGHDTPEELELWREGIVSWRVLPLRSRATRLLALRDEILQRVERKGDHTFALVSYENPSGRVRDPVGDLAPGTTISLVWISFVESQISETAISVRDSFLSLSEPLLDWIEQEHPDLTRYTLKSAAEAQAEWHRRFAETHAFGDPVPVDPSDRVIQTWPDGSQIVQLRCAKSLKAEGLSMGHCVGGYWPQVRDGKSIIWSLRSPTQQPQFTMEILPSDTLLPSGTVRQVQGPQDRSPAAVLLDRPSLAVPLVRLATTWKDTYAPKTSWQAPIFTKFGLPRFIDLDRMRAWQRWAVDMEADGEVAEFLRAMRNSVRENLRLCLPDDIAQSFLDRQAECEEMRPGARRGLTRLLSSFSTMSGGRASVSSVWMEGEGTLRGAPAVFTWRLLLLQHLSPAASVELNCTRGHLRWGISLSDATDRMTLFESLREALSDWRDEEPTVVISGFDADPRETIEAWAHAVAEGVFFPPEPSGRVR